MTFLCTLGSFLKVKVQKRRYFLGLVKFQIYILFIFFYFFYFFFGGGGGLLEIPV